MPSKILFARSRPQAVAGGEGGGGGGRLFTPRMQLTLIICKLCIRGYLPSGDYSINLDISPYQSPRTIPIHMYIGLAWSLNVPLTCGVNLSIPDYDTAHNKIVLV